MNSNSKIKISYVLQLIYLVPFLFFAVAFLLITYFQFTKTVYSEVEIELENYSHGIEALYNAAYPGDYALVGDTALSIYKGEADITKDYSLVDGFKEDTGLDATFFYQDTRIATTIVDDSNKRIIGSGAPEVVIRDVLENGEAKFYHNTRINKEEFFSFYYPLHNSDGSIVGMIFVGKPTSDVKQTIARSLYPLLIALLVVMVVIALILFTYTRKFTKVFLRIHDFLAAVSKGNLNAQLDPLVSERKDELGDIGRSALAMQGSLRHMIEQDTLTGLYNRRSADRKMTNLFRKSAEQGTPFSLSIGDIDFFKKVNDTYGHDCGDIVLKAVSDTIKEHMLPHGFVARWGGEEFLIVFQQMDLEEAEKSLNELLTKIRAMKIPYQDKIVTVTMSFGVTNNFTNEFNLLVKDADDKLYAAKSGGRNRVVSQLPEA